MVQHLIFENLCFNKDYQKTVWPFLKREYFNSNQEKIIFDLFNSYYEKYKQMPSKESLLIDLAAKTGINTADHDSVKETISSFKEKTNNLQWLIDTTEKFCKSQAIFNALSESIIIQENFKKDESQRSSKIQDIGAIPDILKNALQVSFDSSIGMDYFNDAESRYQSYIQKVDKIPFQLDILNKITNGGVERKTLNLVMAGTNVGKSIWLVNMASQYVQQGYNVLYIQMEMSEKVVGKRIDANILNVQLEDFETLTKNTFLDRFSNLQNTKKLGKLFIKEYPTSSAHVGHFRTLLNELSLKKNFVPDVICVDYLGICASSRIRSGAENSYALVKAISEEIRGLAVEQNCVVWSATQTNRGSWENSDFGLEAISESTGQAMTADMILALIETEQLALQGQQLVKQLKSRYADRNQNSHFILGVSKSKQKYFECETQGQVNSQQNKIEETSAKLEKQVIQSKLQTSQEKRSSMEEIQW